MTARDQRINFVVDSDTKSRAKDISDSVGICISELARRGLVEQILQLEARGAVDE